MKNVRIWFKKTGAARYISHLDLNRCMSRAIHKAKIPLWYTQGFNPHAFLTFALPLPLGVRGERESMDVKLDDDDMTRDELIARMNSALPDSIPVFDAAEPVMKPGRIASASYVLLLDPEDRDVREVCAQIGGLFSVPEILVTKHTKRGEMEFNLKPYLDATKLSEENGMVRIDTVLPAGSTMNVNPMLLTESIEKHLGLDLYADVDRTELFNEEGKIFE